MLAACVTQLRFRAPVCKEDVSARPGCPVLYIQTTPSTPGTRAVATAVSCPVQGRFYERAP